MKIQNQCSGKSGNFEFLILKTFIIEIGVFVLIVYSDESICPITVIEELKNFNDLNFSKVWYAFFRILVLIIELIIFSNSSNTH